MDNSFRWQKLIFLISTGSFVQERSEFNWLPLNNCYSVERDAEVTQTHQAMQSLKVSLVYLLMVHVQHTLVTFHSETATLVLLKKYFTVVFIFVSK